MSRFYCLVCAMLMVIALPHYALADRVLVWNKDPLPIVLPIDKEVRMTFPTDVHIQIPVGILGSLESLAPNQQVVYWKATKAFDRARVVVASLDGTSVYMLDLSANTNGTAENLLLEDADRVVVDASYHRSETPASTHAVDDPVEIILTRFASQMLYAPTRLRPTNGDIYTQDNVRLTTDFPLIRSQFGESYHVEVVGSWSGYGRYITAVMMINQGTRPVQVNPGLVQGNFTHITPQHTSLGPKGTIEDRTTLYLISEMPFVAAVQGDGYGY